MSWTGSDLAALFGAVERAMEEHRERLDRLDAVAGDGDHGATMVMGWRTVTAAVGDGAGEPPAAVLRAAAAAFASVGGSIGPLWGTALLRAARAVDERATLSAEDAVRAVKAAAAGIAERGRSTEGDKTLIDTIAPATRELVRRIDGGEDPRGALVAATARAEEAAEATAQLAPRRGRARRLADRSLGHVDPGAASAAVIWSVAADAIGAR